VKSPVVSAFLLASLASGPSGLAHATPEAPEDGDARSEELAREPVKAEKKKKKEDREYHIKGRVFIRETLQREGWQSDFTLSTARLGGTYRDRIYDLRIEVEVEVADGDAEVRDAHVRFDLSDELTLQLGRFKRPISAVALASRWDLPVIERGYVSDFALFGFSTGEPDELPLGGRAIGAAMNWRDKSLPGDPSLTVGVFRSAVHEQIADSNVGTRVFPDASEAFPEDIFSRIEVEATDWLDLGVSLAWVGQLDIAGTGESFRHGFVSGLDTVVEAGPFRGWFEVFSGTSSVHLGADGDSGGRFFAARGIASARWPVSEIVYLEPYLMAQELDASSDFEADRIRQASGGLNMGFGEAWRLQTAVDHASVERLLLLSSSTLFQVQLGTVF